MVKRHRVARTGLSTGQTSRIDPPVTFSHRAVLLDDDQALPLKVPQQSPGGAQSIPPVRADLGSVAVGQAADLLRAQ